ncbi:MAG TPA: hypothetical protein VGF99_13940, partial [Myxococcota bacterium]
GPTPFYQSYVVSGSTTTISLSRNGDETAVLDELVVDSDTLTASFEATLSAQDAGSSIVASYSAVDECP